MNQPASMNQPEPAPHKLAATDATVRGQSLLRAVEVMDALFRPGGDAWARQQTHASLAKYLLEETHEVLTVIEEPSNPADFAQELTDELGDLLFQILFHARIGQEHEPAWNIDDVAEAFIAKMLRRNPHVFCADHQSALEDREDVEAIIAQWHAVKAQEKREQEPSDPWFEGISRELPALHTAFKVVHRARSAQELPKLLDAADNAVSESLESAPASTLSGSTPGRSDRDAEALAWGRELLSFVAEAEAQDVDLESALRTLLRRIQRRDRGA